MIVNPFRDDYDGLRAVDGAISDVKSGTSYDGIVVILLFEIV